MVTPSEKPNDLKQVIVIRRDLNMRRGKEIAQGSHASMEFIRSGIDKQTNMVSLSSIHIEWLFSGMRKIVVKVNSENEINTIVNSCKELGIPVSTIIDSGKTEFHGIPTLTACAVGPWHSEIIDKITGNLSLL